MGGGGMGPALSRLAGLLDAACTDLHAPTIEGGIGRLLLRATGTIEKFDGFLKVYGKPAAKKGAQGDEEDQWTGTEARIAQGRKAKTFSGMEGCRGQRGKAQGQEGKEDQTGQAHGEGVLIAGESRCDE